MKKMRAMFLAAALLCGLAQLVTAAEETTVVLGDSITAANRYVNYYQLYRALRHGNQAGYFIPAGIGGTRANVSDARIAFDIKERNAQKAYVMFGMNDIAYDLYRDPRLKKFQKEALARYEADLNRLVEKLQTSGIAVTLLTPSPYDSYGTNQKTPALPADQGIQAAGDIVRRVAAAHKLPVIDLYSDLATVLKKNPTPPLLNDRIHPNPVGHLILAGSLIAADGAPAVFADQTIDIVGKRIESHGAECSALSVSDGQIAWNYRPAGLPFPLSADYRTADALGGLTGKFNREMLKVNGLADGKYSLAIDGEKIGIFSAGELASGVNLAILNTPMQTLAQRIGKQLDIIRSADSTVNHLSVARSLLEKNKINPDDTQAATQFFKQQLDSGKYAVNSYPYFMAKGYISNIAKLRQHRGYARSCYRKLFEMASSIPTYRFELTAQK